MKKLFFTAMAFAAIVSGMTFTSCSDDDNDPNNGNPEEGENLPGIISEDLELDASKQYFINGSVHVQEGATLTIPAGMTIKARKGFANYILVERGGKIIAEGTADAPITFTADDESKASAGYWGGLILNGYAPISYDASPEEGEPVKEGSTEINVNYLYGGDNANDNSGTLTYVKLLYTGARSSADIEHNGLTLNAVGSGTKIDNIYIAEGADDAIEFFGGSVNVTNLLAVNCDDDMFDFTQGYKGKLSNCYGRWEASFTSTEEDPRGVEADGNLDGNGPDHIQQSDFTIENMTIETASSQLMHDAIKVRRGAKATITNALVKGSGTIKDIVDLTDGKGTAAAGTSITVTKDASNAENGTNSGEAVDCTVTIEAGHTGCTADFGWTGYQL